MQQFLNDGVRGKLSGMKGRLFVANVPMSVKKFRQLSDGSPALAITGNQIEVFVPDSDTYGPVRIPSFTAQGKLTVERMEHKQLVRSVEPVDITTAASFLYFPPKISGQQVPERFKEVAGQVNMMTPGQRIIFEKGVPDGSDYVIKKTGKPHVNEEEITTSDEFPTKFHPTYGMPLEALRMNLPKAPEGLHLEQRQDRHGNIENGMWIKPKPKPQSYDINFDGEATLPDGSKAKFGPQSATVTSVFGYVWIPQTPVYKPFPVKPKSATAEVKVGRKMFRDIRGTYTFPPDKLPSYTYWPPRLPRQTVSPAFTRVSNPIITKEEDRCIIDPSEGSSLAGGMAQLDLGQWDVIPQGSAEGTPPPPEWAKPVISPKGERKMGQHETVRFPAIPMDIEAGSCTVDGVRRTYQKQQDVIAVGKPTKIWMPWSAKYPGPKQIAFPSKFTYKSLLLDPKPGLRTNADVEVGTPVQYRLTGWHTIYWPLIQDGMEVSPEHQKRADNKNPSRVDLRDGQGTILNLTGTWSDIHGSEWTPGYRKRFREKTKGKREAVNPLLKRAVRSSHEQSLAGSNLDADLSMSMRQEAMPEIRGKEPAPGALYEQRGSYESNLPFSREGSSPPTSRIRPASPTGSVKSTTSTSGAPKSKK